MTTYPWIRKIQWVCLVAIAFMLAACSAKDSPTASSAPEQTGNDAKVSTPVSDDTAQEPEFDASMVQTAELPEGFPASFPLPEGAQVTSNLSLLGEDDFRVFLALVMPAEEALSFYQRKLPANGWMIEEQMETSRGTEMTLSSSEYSGELLFVAADTGAALDVHLFPLGTGDFIPDMAGELGDSASLGEGASSFPADFPIPTSYTPIDLPARARSEGYELAFTSSSMTEMAMVDLNVAVMTAGWEIGEPAVDAASGVYVIPFLSPANGFQGYASILRDGSGYGLGAGNVLILMAPGTP